MIRSEVLRFCRQEALFSPGERVICAVSGGADSMALLWCLHSLQAELRITLIAAHFNHCLRGEASDADECLVKEFCMAHRIPLLQGRGNVAGYAAQTGKSIEEAARDLRYEFLHSQACDKIATAHHADDNAETVLLHLLRGSGLRGLCGIPPKRERVVRPFLSVTRAEIMDYVRQEQLPWSEDESNGTDDCLRNRLRHHVLPLLRAEEPKLAQKLTAQSRLLRGEDWLLDDLAAQLLDKAKTGEDLYACKPILTAADPLQKRALRLMLRPHLPKDAALCHIEAMQRLLSAPSPSARVCLPGGLIVRRVYESITVTAEKSEEFSEKDLPIPGEIYLPELGLKISAAIAENFEKNANTPFHFAVKYDMIAQSILNVRPRREKDRLFMNGGHSKSLKKLFIERRIPRALRGRVPVIAQDGEVLAVAGIGVSERHAAALGEIALIIDIEKKEM